ncbi:hypothetical protein AURANDRAFT_68009 [Aureococcus anophagefferens]|uniref:Uncharacterized protein n=1 Tax=Aureococcus anophagefferens TaxID=44056 RepID=F0YN75_AURAN|nr:hypothetical protein AURANDRAFT_68009 [Aureococcus anophagefferens]EGB03453.1 hypothetical protein AURANDRAFT_68009 [Aureococcus anophagefferens]|eukprot:XP_009041852.1 hypothetical protein AURANDRAFT_68009 [Aureococcus anophagefferens]
MYDGTNIERAMEPISYPTCFHHSKIRAVFAMKSKSNAKQIKAKRDALGDARYASFISTYSNKMECKLPGEHKSKLKQAEEINDLLLLDTRRPRPRLCRREYQEPDQESREVWDTGAGKAAQAKSLPTQAKQRKRKAPRAPKQPKEKKPKEEKQLEQQKKIKQQARQIEELQQQHQQTNQKLLSLQTPNDTQANSFKEEWFEKGAKQTKESIEWGLTISEKLNREAAKLDAERAKLQHLHYMEYTQRSPAQSQGQKQPQGQNPTLFPPPQTPPALFAPAAPAPAPAALMLAAAAHAPAAHAPAAPATAAPATAAPAAAAPAAGNATEEMATLAASLRAGAITFGEFMEHAKRLTQP